MKRTSIFLVLSVFITVMVLFAGCATQQPANVMSPQIPAQEQSVATPAPETPTAMRNIIETAEADGRFTTFVSSAKANGSEYHT